MGNFVKLPSGLIVPRRPGLNRRALLAGLGASIIVPKSVDAGALINSYSVDASVCGSPPAASFRNTYSDTTNLTTYTFASSDLGTPDCTRMVVVVVSGFGTNAISSVTVDGTGATSCGTAVAIDNCRMSMWRAASTANSTGTITVVFAGSMFNCAIGVYALYPSSQTPVDYVTNTGSGATIVISDVAKTNGGFTILHSHIAATGRTVVHTQNGAETIVEDVDTSIESLASYSYAHHLNTATTTTDDYTATSSGGTNAGYMGATWF